MRSVSVYLWALFATLFVALPLAAQPPGLSHSPRELGVEILREVSIRDGKIGFRADSNGCTDAGSFRVQVERREGLTPGVPRYRLTIERVRIDECKAMLWDGVVIELDLREAAGLTGSYTLTLINPVVAGEHGRL